MCEYEYEYEYSEMRSKTYFVIPASADRVSLRPCETPVRAAAGAACPVTSASAMSLIASPAVWSPACAAATAVAVSGSLGIIQYAQ